MFCDNFFNLKNQQICGKINEEVSIILYEISNEDWLFTLA